MAAKLSPDNRVHVLAVEIFKGQGASLENSRYIVSVATPQIIIIPHKIIYRMVHKNSFQLEDLFSQWLP